MKNKNDETDWDRRGFLKCMAWVGTGAVWAMTSGILRGMPLEQAAHGATPHPSGGATVIIEEPTKTRASANVTDVLHRRHSINQLGV